MTLLTSCIGNNDKTELVSPIQLTSEEMIFDDSTVLMKFPYKIKLYDSKLFILDPHAPQGYFINVLEYPNLKHIASVGYSGKGPKELISLSCFDIYNDSLCILDPVKAQMFKYCIRTIQHSTSPDRVIQYSKEFIPILNYAKTKEGLIIVNNSQTRQIIKLLDSDINYSKITNLPTYDDSRKSTVPVQYLPSLWDGILAYDEKSDLITFATKLGDVIEIIQVNDSISTIIGNGGLPDVVDLGGGKISIGKVNGFSDIKIADNKIYTLYSGASREDLANLKKSSVCGGNRLIVYNLDGEMIASYELDIYVNGFDIDNNTIIGINSNSSDSPICTFQLPI